MPQQATEKRIKQRSSTCAPVCVGTSTTRLSSNSPPENICTIHQLDEDQNDKRTILAGDGCDALPVDTRPELAVTCCTHIGHFEKALDAPVLAQALTKKETELAPKKQQRATESMENEQMGNVWRQTQATEKAADWVTANALCWPAERGQSCKIRL